jgi:hypothetical protein
MARHGLKINRFDGGLNTKASPEACQPNESPDLLNVEFDDLGAVVTRGGNNTVANIGYGVVQLCHGFLSDASSAQLLAVCSGTAYYSTDSSTFAVCPNGTDIMTAGVMVYAENHRNHAFMVNGAFQYKWDGAHITRLLPSVPGQMGSGTAYDGPAQTNIGSASYTRTYTDVFGAETQASTARTAHDSLGTSGMMGLSFVLTAPSDIQGVAFVNVYRKCHTPLQDQFYLLTSYANTGVDATVFDDYSSLLTTALPYEVAVDPTPPPLSVFHNHVGITFGACDSYNPTWLYYSSINKPSKWAGDQFIRVGDGDGYPIRGIATYGANLLIAKDDGKGSGSCWVLYTPDAEPGNWQITRLDTAYGAVSARAMARFANFIMLLNKNGIYDLGEGTVGENLSNPISFNIEPDVFDFTDDHLSKACAVVFKNKVYLSVPTSDVVTNNTMYVYDFVRGRGQVEKSTGAWAKFDVPDISSLTVHQDGLWGGDYNGNVHQLEVGHADDGAAINSYYTTAQISGIEEHYDSQKTWRFLWISIEHTGPWNVDVTYAEDLEITTGTTKTIALNPNGALWGSGIFGSSVYGATVKRTKVRIPIALNSKKIQVKFSTNVAGHWFKIYDMLLEYNLQGIR